MHCEILFGSIIHALVYIHCPREFFNDLLIITMITFLAEEIGVYPEKAKPLLFLSTQKCPKC
jgi:hypothetical membrane protein